MCRVSGPADAPVWQRSYVFAPRSGSMRPIPSISPGWRRDARHGGSRRLAAIPARVTDGSGRRPAPPRRQPGRCAQPRRRHQHGRRTLGRPRTGPASRYRPSGQRRSSLLRGPRPPPRQGWPPCCRASRRPSVLRRAAWLPPNRCQSSRARLSRYPPPSTVCTIRGRPGSCSCGAGSSHANRWSARTSRTHPAVPG